MKQSHDPRPFQRPASLVFGKPTEFAFPQGIFRFYLLKTGDQVYKPNYTTNISLTARLVDGNEVMGMKCCNGNSNEGMNMRIGNEDSFVWCA